MWARDGSFQPAGFSTPPPSWKSAPAANPPRLVPMSERKRVSPAAPPKSSDLFHASHKVPAGDSPYVRAKQVQLIDKNPSKAISLFWAAINAGDRVDSALKDMAVVMKQLDRAEEAIEAIKSFRHLCPFGSQESLNNVLVELYKRAGRIEDEIEMLQSKLKRMDDGIAFNGKKTKTARAQGKKVQITVEQERSRVLGNLAWAYMQQGNYTTAEEYYKNALALEPDKNKQCNLAVCLMHKNRITEARHLLQAVRDSSGNKPMDDTYAKSFERAFEMLTDLETRSIPRPNPQSENYCTGISRTAKQVNSLTNGGQQNGSVCMPLPPRRWTDGPDNVHVLVDEHRREAFRPGSSRTAKQVNSLTNGGQQNGSVCMPLPPRRWTDGPDNVHVLVDEHRREAFRPGSCAKSSDKWKDYDHNTCGSRPTFYSKLKENQGGMIGADVNPHKNIYSSPVIYTQPRRRSWGFSDGQQRSEIWAHGVGSSNKKLPSERSTGQDRSHAVRNLNADLLALTTRKSETPSSQSCGNWRRPQGDAVARPVLQPISSRNSRGNEGDYDPVRNEAMIGSSKHNGDRKRVARDNGGLKKSAAEPQMLNESAKAHEVSFGGGEYLSSATNVKRSMENMNASVEKECLGDISPGKLDNVDQSPTANEDPTPDFWTYSAKRSWADMVEEDEEEEQLNGRTWYVDSWYSDENRNPNTMTPQSPRFQTQMKDLSRKAESVDLKGDHVTSENAISPRHPTTRRSLVFDQQQESETVDYISTSPAAEAALNREDSVYGKNLKLMRRNRLQSFQDITE